MTNSQQAIVMTFGAMIAVAGLVLLFYRTEEGKNRIKLFGQEIEISTPGVLVFLVGSGIFVMPFVLPLQKLRDDGLPSAPVTAPVTVAPLKPSPPSAPGTETPAKSTTLVLSEEKEPNDHIAAANRIAVGTTIRGQLSAPEDRDFFVFRSE